MSCFRIPKLHVQLLSKSVPNSGGVWTMKKRKCTGQLGNSFANPKKLGGLGFRKLETFNKSQLTKQVWRIIQNHHTLVMRALKVIYFKHVDIIQESLGNKPSFIWWSLIWSRELLKAGLCWRIGAGVDIFCDRWISTLGVKTPLSYGSSPKGLYYELVDN